MVSGPSVGEYDGIRSTSRCSFDSTSSARSRPPEHRFRFRNKLYSFDASVVDLCLSVFPWAKFRRTKGAIKLHALLDHDGHIPSFLRVTTGSTHDIRQARNLVP